MIESYKPAKVPSMLLWVLTMLALGVVGSFATNSVYHDSLTEADHRESVVVDSLFRSSMADRILLHAEVDSLRDRIRVLERRR